MASHDNIIPEESFKQDTTQGIVELHLTGGVRAIEDGNRRWIWHPVLSGGTVQALEALPINRIDQHAGRVGLLLFGGDQQSGLEGSLVSRSWTPLNGAHDGTLQPADLWGAIAGNADKAGDEAYARVARYISFTLHAAGIRLRDASDGYRAQLLHAVEMNCQHGRRYANIPMRDIQLAFHSVLSELASARDYLAKLLAGRLGAPQKVDAMRSFAAWLDKAQQAHLRSEPVVAEMLAAYDATSADPWLHQLTEYRNIFTHRQPMGSTGRPQCMVYEIVTVSDIEYPRITLPLSDGDAAAHGQDALTRFVGLYRSMISLSKLAAANAPYSTQLPSFEVR